MSCQLLNDVLKLLHIGADQRQVSRLGVWLVGVVREGLDRWENG